MTSPSARARSAVMEQPPNTVVIARRLTRVNEGEFSVAELTMESKFTSRHQKIGHAEGPRMTRVRTMRRMPLVRDVPRLVLVLLVLASAAPTGCCAGAEEWVPTTKPSSSQPWFTGPDDPPADTEPTDIERELFHTRTTSCAVCQRAVMYLDEHLLVRILDERARSISPNDPANYGRLETIVEDKIGKVCSASGIQLDKKARNACDDMLARFETQLVKAWYERSVQDDDWNMNWRICAKKHGMLKVCPLEISRFDVPTLDHLEQELKIEELRAPIKVDTETGRTQPRYQSQPTPVGRAEIARAGSGKMNVLTGRDFVHRVIAEENTDHLVYFGYPNKYPRVHKATMRVLTRVAGAFKDPGVKKHHVAMSALDLVRLFYFYSRTYGRLD
jgi:hypothetical protein